MRCNWSKFWNELPWKSSWHCTLKSRALEWITPRPQLIGRIWKISTDLWNSLTLSFKVMVKLYEFRNAEIDTCVYGLAGLRKISWSGKQQIRALSLNLPLIRCVSLDKPFSLSRTQMSTFARWRDCIRWSLHSLPVPIFYDLKTCKRQFTISTQEKRC